MDNFLWQMLYGGISGVLLGMLLISLGIQDTSILFIVGLCNGVFLAKPGGRLLYRIKCTIENYLK